MVPLSDLQLPYEEGLLTCSLLYDYGFVAENLLLTTLADTAKSSTR